MEFLESAAGAMTWPSLTAAGRALDAAFEFGPRHQLYFVKSDQAGRLQPRSGGVWAVEVFNDGRRLGFLARFVMRGGEARFL